MATTPPCRCWRRADQHRAAMDLRARRPAVRGQAAARCSSTRPTARSAPQATWPATRAAALTLTPGSTTSTRGTQPVRHRPGVGARTGSCLTCAARTRATRAAVRRIEPSSRSSAPSTACPRARLAVRQQHVAPLSPISSLERQPAASCRATTTWPRRWTTCSALGLTSAASCTTAHCLTTPPRALASPFALVLSRRSVSAPPSTLHHPN